MLFDQSGVGTTIDTSYPTPTAPISGDLSIWECANARGDWTLKVVDDVFLNNAIDGEIVEWSVSALPFTNAVEVAGGGAIAIPDNNPVGVADTLLFPDAGLAQKLLVTVDLDNSDIAGLELRLTDPNGDTHVLYDQGGSGTGLATSFPNPTALVSGDLSVWAGENPQGSWTLRVIDTLFLNNTVDGQVNGWSLTSVPTVGVVTEKNGTIPIPDNSPIGVSDTISFPNVGSAEAVLVAVDLVNSDISGLTLTLTDPLGNGYTLYDQGSVGTTIDTTYPDPTVPVSGDLSIWEDANPAGDWTLKVVDDAFLNNAIDGQVDSWSVTALSAMGPVSVSSTATPVGIPDNSPVGVATDIVLPPLGLAQNLQVSIDITNSAISGIEVRLTDPEAVTHVLYDQSGVGPSLVDSYPFDTLPVSGDLSSWSGKDPSGTWTLRVIDTLFLNNTIDGQINAWSIENLPAVGSFADLGSGLAGTVGVPSLTGHGTLLAGDPVTLVLGNAVAFSTSTLVVGLFAINAPFKGGTLVPSPDFLFFGLPTGPAGSFSLASPWPAGFPSGFSTYFQHWIADAGGPVGFSASNALSATTP